MSDVKAPPQNIEAEESVLGAMLVAEPALRKVLVESGLTSKSFYLEKHGEIYAAIQKVAHRDGSADELTVGAELPSLKVYVSELAAKVPAAGNAPHYARIVALNANLRMKLAGAQTVQAGVYELDEDKREGLIREGLDLIATDLETEAAPTSEEELADDFFRYLDQEEPAEVMRLPFEELNECVFGGYRRGQTTVIAGWTEMGKSWWLDQVIGGFYKQGYRSAIFATEMDKRERVARFVAAKTGVAMEKLLLKKLTSADMAKVVKVLPEIPFSYFEVNGWPAERICQQIILGGYDVAAIDVVNLIPGYEDNKDATRILSRFMEVARRANCHVILVSHLNRARATQAKLPRPVKRDLRDSGMLETNAGAILFVHRNQDDKGEALTTGEIFFEKVRNGMKGGVDVLFDPTSAQFELDPDATSREEDQGGLFDDDSPPQTHWLFEPRLGFIFWSDEPQVTTPDELVKLVGELDVGDIRALEEFTAASEAVARARRDADAITGDIDSPERYSEATDAMKFLDDAVKDAEAARKKVKKPFDDAGKFVQASFTELKGSTKAARESLEQRALAFERKREKEERERREAEEADARKREAEAKAQGEAEEARAAREDVDRAMAPRAEVGGARGATGAKASPTSELKYEITDEAALPDQYVNRVPNRAAILEAVRQGIAVPGVRPYRDKKVRVR